MSCWTVLWTAVIRYLGHILAVKCVAHKFIAVVCHPFKAPIFARVRVGRWVFCFVEKKTLFLLIFPQNYDVGFGLPGPTFKCTQTVSG